MFMRSPVPIPRIGARLVRCASVSAACAISTGCRPIGFVTPTPSCIRPARAASEPSSV